MRKEFVAGLAVVITVLLAACSQQEPQNIAKESMRTPMAKPGDLPRAHMTPPADAVSPHGAAIKKKKVVMVPREVRETWRSVRLVMIDRKEQKTMEFVVALGKTAQVPGTPLQVNVGAFLPDFKMTDTTITSDSNEPRNPAVHVEVVNGGQSIFTGWLYAKFPEIHPFGHFQYGLRLKEGVKN